MHFGRFYHQVLYRFLIFFLVKIALLFVTTTASAMIVLMKMTIQDPSLVSVSSSRLTSTRFLSQPSFLTVPTTSCIISKIPITPPLYIEISVRKILFPQWAPLVSFPPWKLIAAKLLQASPLSMRWPPRRMSLSYNGRFSS